MLTAVLAILIGLLVLVWSAERFVVGAAVAAAYAKVPPLLIGMIVVGFGTSMPETVVSVTASLSGDSDLALGNALGSNIVNVGLVLGLAALIAPILVNSNIVRRELPLLLAVSILFGLVIWDLEVTRLESSGLLFGFILILSWSIYMAFKNRGDALEIELEHELSNQKMRLGHAIIWTAIGLISLIASSRLLVWGAVELAVLFGVNNLIIGLTVVALGTSFPELATSVVAARRGEHEIAIGNVVGSNMFNLLVVVGIAGVIEPMNSISNNVLLRDWPVMVALTILLLLMAYGFRKQGSISRLEGAVLLVTYTCYTCYLVYSASTT